MLPPNSHRKEVHWRVRYHYFITVFTVGLIMISSGCAVAWPSPSFHKLRTGQTPIEHVGDDITGIGYYFFIGGMPGFVITWFFLKYTGRKAGLLTASFLFALSWGIMALAKTIIWIYVARLIQGTAQALSLILAPVYIVEISQVSYREVSGLSMQFFFNLGLLIQYSLGPYVTYHILIYTNISIALLFSMCFHIVANETPYFLYMKNCKLKAEEELRRLRQHIQPPNQEEIENELYMIQKMVEDREQYSLISQIKLFLFDKAVRKALLIAVGLTYLFVFSGISQLLMFAETMFRKSEVSISPSLSCVFIGLVKLLGGFVLPFFVKSLGIKKMTVFSAASSSIVMFFLGLLYFLKGQGYGLNDLYWAPLVLFLLYFFLASTGIAFIVMHVRAEIFPPHLKPTGILLQEICNIVCLELCSIFFTQLLYAVYIPLWFFSISMFLSVIFIIYYLPESKTMTLYDIQQWLSK